MLSTVDLEDPRKLIPRSWNRALTEGGAVLAGQLAMAVAGLVGSRLITEAAPPEVLGRATLIIGLLTLLRNLTIAPLANGLIRFYPEYQRNHQGTSFISSVTAQARPILVGSAGLLMLVYGLWEFIQYKRVEFAGLALAAMIFVTDSIKSIHTGLLNAARHQARLSLWSSVEAWALPLAIVGIMAVSRSTGGYLLAQWIVSVLCLLVFFLIPTEQEPRKIDGPARAELRNQLWRYGWPFVPLAVMGWVTSIGDRYLIGGMLRVSDVGIYAAAYGLASKPLLMMSGTFSNWLRPVLFWHQSHGNSARARTIFLNWCAAVAACGCVAVVLAWLCGPIAARILLAEEYRKDAASVFVWVVAGYSIYAVVQAIENRLLSFTDSAALIIPNVVASLSNICFNLLLIPRHGVVGAAEATCSSFALQLVCVNIVLLTPRGEKSVVNSVKLESSRDHN